MTHNNTNQNEIFKNTLNLLNNYLFTEATPQNIQNHPDYNQTTQTLINTFENSLLKGLNRALSAQYLLQNNKNYHPSTRTTHYTLYQPKNTLKPRFITTNTQLYIAFQNPNNNKNHILFSKPTLTNYYMISHTTLHKNQPLNDTNNAGIATLFIHTETKTPHNPIYAIKGKILPYEEWTQQQEVQNIIRTKQNKIITGINL